MINHVDLFHYENLLDPVGRRIQELWFMVRLSHGLLRYVPRKKVCRWEVVMRVSSSKLMVERGRGDQDDFRSVIRGLMCCLLDSLNYRFDFLLFSDAAFQSWNVLLMGVFVFTSMHTYLLRIPGISIDQQGPLGFSLHPCDVNTTSTRSVGYVCRCHV